jgi:hypothetical protein
MLGKDVVGSSRGVGASVEALRKTCVFPGPDSNPKRGVY